MPTIRDPLIVSGVIGDVLDPFTRCVDLSVVYNNNRIVYNGCALRPSQVVNQPMVEIGGDDFRTFYTLAKDWKQDSQTQDDFKIAEIYVHQLLTNPRILLVTDIPATTGANFGNEIVSYESPRPSLGIHRFIFVLFRQLDREAISAPDIIDSRRNFNTRDFARFHNLNYPVAAVYFNCNREGGTGGRRL